MSLFGSGDHRNHRRGCVLALINPPPPMLRLSPLLSQSTPLCHTVLFTNNMTTLSEPSAFESLFQSALGEYQIQTGVDLRRHPLAHQLDLCDSLLSVTELLQQQAQAFREFRERNNKFITLLKHVAQALHKLSTPVVHAEAIGLVRPNPRCVLHFRVSHTFFTARVTCENNTHLHRNPPFCMCLSRSHKHVVVTYKRVGGQRRQCEL